MQKIRIATRKSQLALWQSEHVSHELKKHHPSLEVELIPFSTQGDILLDSPLAKIGGKGLFVKELEQALIDNKADIAVHSMKDVPVELPQGLSIACVGKRECPWDALVGPYSSIIDLPEGATVGTSSLRRQVQLIAARPDLNIVSLRGNVNTRLKKLKETNLDAIILAAAGLIRLDLANEIAMELTLAQDWLPAICQGVIGIECRTDDPETKSLIACFNDPKSHLTTLAERTLNKSLNGGCQAPVGGYAQWLDESHLQLDAFVSNGDKMIIRARGQITIDVTENHQQLEQQCVALGNQVAEKLDKLGAQRLLREARESYSEP